ncbi:MAG: hypothetical protein IJB73_00945 [Firmicutes bacterium]|nr:hypothetical protein [Bacillota bacterium]
MKKFLTVLLVIAVMFTFSFGSAFAVTEAQNENVQAIKAEAGRLQANLAAAGTAYLNTLTWDADGYTTVASTKISKAVFETQMALYVADAQTKLNETSVYLQTAASVDANDAITKTAWLAYLMTGVETSEAIIDTAPSEDKAGYTALVNFGSASTFITGDALAVAEYKAVVAAANEKFAEYLAKLNDYSTNPDAWSVTATDADVTTYAYDGSNKAEYTFEAIAGMTDAQTLDAKGFVKAVIDTQKAVVNGNTNKVTAASGAQAKLNSIAAAVKTAKDIIEGHKITTDENYFVAAVPTAAELAADTTVDSAKSTAIAQMKADLASAQLVVKNVLTSALSAESKKAKPDADLVAALQAAVDDLNKQVAASEEVYTAQINDCDTVAEVDALYDIDNAGTGTLEGEVAVLAGTTNYATNNNAATTFTATGTQKGAEFYLERNLERSESVAELQKYAALLAEVKDVNGEKFYNAAELANALETAISEVYAGNMTLAQAKAAISDDYDVALMRAQAGYSAFIAGDTTVTAAGGYFNTTKPEDKYGAAVTTVWAKSTAAGTAGTVTITDGANNATIAAPTTLYDEAQAAALKALVEETTAAIEAAATITEIEDIFAAAHEKYLDIETTTDHVGYWNGGKLATAASKAAYPDSLYKYATYLMSTVDATKYNVNAANLYQVGAEVLYEAYAADELEGKFADAKAAMAAALITKADVNAQKAAVEAAISAIGTVTLESKDAIVAACDALDAYNDLAGTNPVVTNEYVLDAAKVAYHKLADAELTKAYKALPATTKVTVADQAAIEALRAAYDAYEVLSDDYGFAVSTVNDNQVKAYETALSNAKVAAAAEALYKVPTNPTAEDAAAVEAARAAYEALTLEEKIALRTANALAYDNLIDAEEALGLNTAFDADDVKAYLQDLSVKARSVKTKAGNVKVTVKADVDPILEAGYTVEYKFYRSTKSNKGFGKAKKVSEEATYTNTSGVKGTKYYYKAVIVVKDAEGVEVAKTPLKHCLYATRTWTK